MGSNYTGVGKIRASSKEEALLKAEDIIAKDEAYYGTNPYSGSYATCPGAEFIAARMDEAAADEYICENHHKREPMMVIQDSVEDDLYYYGAWCAE